jgi:hypothetical protein
MKRPLLFLLVPGILPWAGLHAQQATLGVFARVEESCNVTVPARGVLRATCTPHTSYFLGPEKGVLPGATMLRQVISAVQAPEQTGVGTGKPVDHTLFGGVPAAEFAADPVSVRVYY